MECLVSMGGIVCLENGIRGTCEWHQQPRPEVQASHALFVPDGARPTHAKSGPDPPGRRQSNGAPAIHIYGSGHKLSKPACWPWLLQLLLLLLPCASHVEAGANDTLQPRVGCCPACRGPHPPALFPPSNRKVCCVTVQRRAQAHGELTSRLWLTQQYCKAADQLQQPGTFRARLLDGLTATWVSSSSNPTHVYSTVQPRFWTTGACTRNQAGSFFSVDLMLQHPCPYAALCCMAHSIHILPPSLHHVLLRVVLLPGLLLLQLRPGAKQAPGRKQLAEQAHTVAPTASC
eukprot:874472-Pelagomonas_calceolata.AAC.2